MRDGIRLRLKPLLERLYSYEANAAAKWVSAAHRRLMDAQWGIQPTPEHFDHTIDLFYKWRATRNSFWLERGVFGGIALKGGRVLELACGDGFNARNFYSLRSTDVIACDFDPSAISTAESKNSAPNVRYMLADIRTDMPEGKFENVVWDAAIEHFTIEETADILRNIKTRLTADGILSGYTLVERSTGKGIPQHEYEFHDADDLRRTLTPHFKNVKVFETVFPDRHNLYFWASDGSVPFS